MTKSQIIQSLIKVHRKYSGEKFSDRESQMCTLWSTLDPPDILEGTAPLNEIEKVFEFSFTEMQAVEFYDMTIEEAAEYIFKLLKSQS